MTNEPGAFTLIKAARLLDGAGGRPIEDAAVLIEGETIRAVGRRADVSAPEGATVEVLDFGGRSLMPGMVDCHTHNNGFGDGRPGDDVAELPDEVLTLQSARNARISLLSGVTSIRENGPKNMTMFRLRDAVREGREIGPRMVLCGRPISIIGGHMWYFGSEVTGPTEARAMARQLIKEGADYLKITATGGSTATSHRLRPAFDVDELAAITGEARKFGRLTATHCLSAQGIVNSLDAGVDMIIHCVFKEPDGSDRFRPEVAERIAEQGAYVNPTLHVMRARGWTLGYVRERRPLTPAEQSRLDECQRDFETHLDHCRRMIEMGVKMITGSDSSWGDYQLGNTPYETECLVMAGMSPARGVVSVTGDAATSLGIDDVAGTLEPGKAADLVVVDGNPADRVQDLWNVDEVFLAGRRVDRGSAESLAALRQHPPGGV